MNKKLIFITIAIIAALVDIGLSGKYDPLHYFVFFPVVFFILLLYFRVEDVVISGLVYGFLFDVASLANFPAMTVTMIFVLGVARFLKGRIIDGSHPINALIFSIIIGIILFTISSAVFGGSLIKPVFFISLFYNSVVSGFIYVITKFLLDRFFRIESE